MRKLTIKQEKFAQKYVEFGNASKAYRAAYNAKGMSDEAVKVEASRLLDNPNVALTADSLKNKAAEKSGISIARVQKEYARLAFLDIRKAFDENGNLKPIHEIDDDTAAAIAGLEVSSETDKDEDGNITVSRLHKVKLSDKRASLDSLAKHLGMFDEKPQEVNVNVNWKDKTREEKLTVAKTLALLLRKGSD